MPKDNKNKNNVDGLLSSKNDLAGSRKIVLDSIGEGGGENENARRDATKINSEEKTEVKAEKAKPEKEKKVFRKNVDGIKFLDSFNLLDAEKIEEATNHQEGDLAETDPEIAEKMEKNAINPTLINDINKRGISFDDLADLVNNDTGEVPALKNKEKAKHAVEEKAPKKTTKDRKKKPKEVRKLKSRKIEKKLKPKPEPKLKKPKSPINWQKKFAFVFKFFEFGRKYKKNFPQYLRRATSRSIVFFLIFILIYLAYATTILKFKLDNEFTRFLGSYAPIPAYISGKNTVDYFLWQDIKNFAEKQGQEAPRKALARFLALNELSLRYGINFPGYQSIYDLDLNKKIEEKAIMDKYFNPVALNRIEGINNMIKNKEDFIRVSEKHGDALGRVTLNSENREQYPEELKNLAVGEISKIIGSKEGYYIYKCFEANESEQSLSYVFVESDNFEKKLNELMASYRLVSLVD